MTPLAHTVSLGHRLKPLRATNRSVSRQGADADGRGGGGDGDQGLRVRPTDILHRQRVPQSTHTGKPWMRLGFLCR